MTIAARFPAAVDTIVVGAGTADASVMPAVTSGNTNMPTAVIGERIARSLLGLQHSR
jgi:choline dehydrogenase-like flavoprotein